MFNVTGRQADMKRRNATVRLRVADALLAELRLEAEEQGRTVSDVVRRLLVQECAKCAIERESGRQEAA
jgi:hypothetical protein